MPKAIPAIVGGLEIVGGAVAAAFGLAPLAAFLISAGVGTLISGIGTLLSKGPVNGFATTVRNPTSPWKSIYGECATGGTVVYMNMWGDSAKMLDLVVVLAAHPCQSVDELLFDRKRVQLDSAAVAPGAAAGSGTSFTPVQQTVTIFNISRSNGVVTVVLHANIPYLTAGEQVIIQDVPGDLTLNGKFQVAEILSQVFGSPGSITFTYISGGIDSTVGAAGHCKTTWQDYGRKVYMEVLLGNQALGETFKGMTLGTPYDGNRGNMVSPERPQGLGGNSSPTPNPWTRFCSLQGKTAVFLRLHYNDQYFAGGLPQISFVLHGKNDIIDTRTSPFTIGYTENAALCIADFLNNPTWGYDAAYGSEIPIANLNAAANVCDEQVPLAVGGIPPITESAYTCNGQFDLSMRRGEILQNLLTSCGGRLTYEGGQFIIWPAAYVGVSFAIGSDPGGGVAPLPPFTQIAAGPIRWHPTVSIRDLYNGVKGTYIAPENKWQATDFPPYAQDALHGYSGPAEYEGDINLANDLGIRRWLDIQLPFTTSFSMAQRIAKIELLRRRHFGTGTLSLNMWAYQIATLDLMYVTIPFLNWNQKQLEVTAARLRMEEGQGAAGSGIPLAVELDVQENSPEIYEWSTSEELSPQGYQQPEIPGIGSRKFFATEGTPGIAFPFPWLPGYVVPLIGDGLYTGPVVSSHSKAKASFGLGVVYGADNSGNPTAQMQIKGTPPINQLSTGNPPQITCTVGTSGSLPAGQYVVMGTAKDTSTPPKNTKFSVPIIVTIPEQSPPANVGSIAVSVLWPADSDGGEIYMGRDSINFGLHFQVALAAASTGTTLTYFDESTNGGVDEIFEHFAVVWKRVTHGGPWAQQVQAITADTITIAGPGMTVDQWAGRILTLLGKLDETQELIILNMPVAANTASSGSPATFDLTIGPNAAGDQLPDLSTLLVPGDLLVMRFKAIFGPSSFQDTEIANPYFPSGAADTNIEPGHLVMVLTGPDIGDVQTIASISGVNNDTFQLAGKWKIQPNDGDIVIVVDPAYSPEVPTHIFQVPNRGAFSGVVASPQIQNLANETWAVLVRTETKDAVSGPDAYARVREIFFFGAQGTRTINSSQDQLPTDRIIDVDASGGDVDFTLLAFADIPNQSLYVQKIDSSANVVNVICQAGDTINGQPVITLSRQWDPVGFVVSG